MQRHVLRVRHGVLSLSHGCSSDARNSRRLLAASRPALNAHGSVVKCVLALSPRTRVETLLRRNGRRSVLRLGPADHWNVLIIDEVVQIVAIIIQGVALHTHTGCSLLVESLIGSGGFLFLAVLHSHPSAFNLAFNCFQLGLFDGMLLLESTLLQSFVIVG